MSANFPYIFTFYSFKGGVGRSMALLNAAYALAGRGRHVLIVDFDLEAPGISGFMRRTKEIKGATKYDAIDLVAWACNGEKMSGDTSAVELDAKAPPFAETRLAVPLEKRLPLKPRFADVGNVDIIGIDTDRDYFNRLSKLGLHVKSQDQLIAAGNALRRWFKAQRIPLDVPDYYPPDAPRDRPYDYVLVDSRTGTTEIGGLCVGPLSDRLVVFTALNDQNIEGTKQFLHEIGPLEAPEEIAEPWDSAEPPPDQADAPARLGPKPTIVVASPVPQGEVFFKRERMEALRNAIGLEAATRLSYHPQMALMETVFIRDVRDEYLAMEYDRFATILMRLVTDHSGQLLSLSNEQFREKRPADAVDSVLRAVADDPDFIFVLPQLVNAFEPETDAEFVAADRMYRVLMQLEADETYILLMNFGVMLSRWADRTSDIATRTQRVEEAIARYTRVIDMADAPAEQRAEALVKRGVRYGKMTPPQTDKEIADYTAVIDMADAPAEQRAQALFNRGVTYGQMTPPQTDKEIADYTAVIDMADAPEELRAGALGSLGWRAYQQGRFDESIELSRSAVDLAPGLAGVRANLALALLCTKEQVEALAEYRRAVADAKDAELLEDMAKDLREAVEAHGPLSGGSEIEALIAQRLKQVRGTTNLDTGREEAPKSRPKAKTRAAKKKSSGRTRNM